MSARSARRLAAAALLSVLAACGAGTAARVTFVLRNSDTQELAFNLDRGWQPNLFAYTGRPPHAKWILMFPTHCTGSCAARDQDRCPLCREPEGAAAELAAQKLARVAPGDELLVPWDGRVFIYKRTRVKRRNVRSRRCECHRTEPAPPATYTVKACGLRLTRSAAQRTRLQCVEGKMTLPSQAPLRIELDFGAPGEPARTAGR